MDTRHARIVREVASSGGISLASERLGMGQPAVSKIVRRLEDEFGAEIFERGPKGVTLSPFGKTFLRYAQVIERETRDLAVEANKLVRGEVGHFRIGAGQTWLNELMPQVLGTVYRERPGISISVVSGSRDALTGQLIGGLLDLAFLPIERSHGPDLSMEEMLRDEVQVVGGRTHPLAQRGGHCTLEELFSYGWIVGEAHRGDSTYRWLTETAQRLGLPMPRIALETSHRQLRLETLKSTDLLSFEPHCSSLVRRGDLILLASDINVYGRGIGMVWRKNRPLGQALSYIMTVARTACAEYQGGHGTSGFAREADV